MRISGPGSFSAAALPGSVIWQQDYALGGWKLASIVPALSGTRFTVTAKPPASTAASGAP